MAAKKRVAPGNSVVKKKAAKAVKKELVSKKASKVVAPGVISAAAQIQGFPVQVSLRRNERVTVTFVIEKVSNGIRIPPPRVGPKKLIM